MATKTAQRPSYVAPVKGQVRRLDQGIDYQGKPGDHVVAIGRAIVNYVKDNPGGFGKAIYYTLLDGPMKGRQIYVGHAQPLVHAGETIAAGAPLATLLAHGLGNASGLAGWTEIGFAKNGAPQPGSATAFQAFVQNLNAAAPGPADSAPAGPTGAPAVGAAGAAAPPPSPYTAPLPIQGGLAEPAALDPGTVPAGAADVHQYQETWQRIAADPWAPPEAANYATLWQGGQ